jgi:cyclophilin family peptidyl-prolyl cis-trans isomerase
MTPAPVCRLVALALVAAAAVSACGPAAAPIMPPGGPTQSPSVAPSVAPSEAPSDAPASHPGGAIPASCPKSAPAPMAADATATVTLATEKGDIVIKVKGSLAPNAAGNFVALAECGYFDGVVFHRLMPGFVIQAGDGQFGRKPNVDTSFVGTGGPGYEFADDPVTTPYARGTVAMANSGPDTNGSQFFICLADIGLDPAYSVFGTVASGMDVVDAIAAMPNTGGQEGRALEPVAITKATVSRP